jgi:hypothetical protein
MILPYGAKYHYAKFEFIFFEDGQHRSLPNACIYCRELPKLSALSPIYIWHNMFSGTDFK